MPTVQVRVSQFRTDRQKQLLNLLNDKRVKKEANKILKDYINVFVPKKSGALRRSAIVTDESISWGRGLPYARYQYGGVVYGRNYPIIKGGRVVGWYSKPGVPKYPTGRMMGTQNEIMGWVFGYSEPNTGYSWDERFKNDFGWRAKANQEITRYLKRECKNRGLNT